jgi:hypothetical protein
VIEGRHVHHTDISILRTALLLLVFSLHRLRKVSLQNVRTGKKKKGRLNDVSLPHTMDRIEYRRQWMANG